jgi:hypothetical protein
MANEGLAAHINFLKTEGDPVPAPRSLEQIENTWDEWEEWVDNYRFLVVPITLLPISTKAKRINIVMNEGLIARVDTVAKNRSEFISRAVEAALG